jgi:DNA (cytosine-5)-methyltransferase 1
MSMNRLRLLDLFCGGGGASMGYVRAGFEVVGVDVVPQPRYPFEFFCADALEVPLEGFDAVHASPPCQAFTLAQRIQDNEHPNLIAPIRKRLLGAGVPYVIENVPGAPLIDPVLLEGQMFLGLRTRRPRLFEANWPLSVPLLRPPVPAPHAKMGRPPKPHEWMYVVGCFSDVNAGRLAMGIDWMTRDELKEAIPPAYTEFIGKQLMAHLQDLRKKAG